MQGLEKLVQQPEYVHAALNHFPLIGLLVAMLALGAGLATRNRTARLIGLGLVCLLSLSVWPVYEYGQAGYDRVLSMSDDAGQDFLRYHAHLAERWVFLYYVTAALAAASLGLSWRWPKLLLPGCILVLVLATASLVAGIVIAQAGGEVRHREFRFRPPPAETEQH